LRTSTKTRSSPPTAAAPRRVSTWTRIPPPSPRLPLPTRTCPLRP